MLRRATPTLLPAAVTAVPAASSAAAAPERSLCRRLLPLLIVALAGVALAAAPAFAAAPAQRIVTEDDTVVAGPAKRVYVLCPKAYKAVAGYVVQRGSAVFVFESEQFPGVESTWIFEVRTTSQTPQQVRFEVRCVKFAAGIDVASPEVARPLSPGQVAELIATCRKGYAPIGSGYRHSGPAGRSDPPPPGTFVHTSKLAPVRAGWQVRFANLTPEPVLMEHQSICVEKRDPRVRESVVRTSSTLDVQGGERREHTQRCPRGSVATAAGWSADPDTRLLVEPTGFNFSRALELLVLSGSPTAERVDIHALCISQRRIHN